MIFKNLALSVNEGIPITLLKVSRFMNVQTWNQYIRKNTINTIQIGVKTFQENHEHYQDS